jgi:hemoglobin
MKHVALFGAGIEREMNSEPNAINRSILIEEIKARTGIDEPMIEKLVHGSYAKARLDPLIGPVFESKVTDWDAHLRRMCAFWSSVTLMSGRYHGQPMVAHAPLPIETPHFNRWLEIFAATATEVCPPQAAEFFIERAHRIADSLEFGIAAAKGEIGDRPVRPPQTLPPLHAAGKS